MLRNGIRTNSNAVCIFQTLARPAETLFGSLDRALSGTLRNLIDNINRELAEYCFRQRRCTAGYCRLGRNSGLGRLARYKTMEYGEAAVLR